MKGINAVFVFIAILCFSMFLCFCGSASAEELTLTTYYPAPYGVYRQMRATESLLLQAEPMNSNGPQLEWRTSGIGVDRHWNIDQYQDPGSTRLRFFTEDNAGDINPAIRLTILENGNVGIGTVNPNYQLDVVGAARLSGSGIGGLAAIVFNDTDVGATNFQIRPQGNKLRIGAAALGDLIIDSSGNVGIGTTAPDGKLGVEGEINFVPQNSAPAADKGDLYYDNNDDEFKYYDGSGWQALGGGGVCFTYYCVNPLSSSGTPCVNSGGAQGHCPAGFNEIHDMGFWGHCHCKPINPDHYHYYPPGGGCDTACKRYAHGKAYLCCQ